VCSIAGIVAGGRSCGYHVSKFGLLGFTEALRAEYGRRGLNVTALCPGPVQTALYRSGVSGRSDREVPEPPGWACASPERVASRGVAGVRRNRRMVLVTPLAYGLYWVHRIAPWALDLANQATKSRKRSKPVSVPQASAMPASEDAAESSRRAA
jgi:short-subunit dehydrogenase